MTRRSLLALPFAAAPALAQQRPAPTMANVAYGPYERTRLDFYPAPGEGPRPLAVFIHGGGFVGGSKASVNADALRDLLAAGVSVAAIEYRFIQDSVLPSAHHDSRRAIQFLRSKADEWAIDKTRVAAFGGSAGAQISLWLAFADEMANPDAPDPVERESTRLSAVAGNGAQTTLDFDWWKTNIPGDLRPPRPAHLYFGTSDPHHVARIARSLSALDLASADDPPTYLSYGMKPDDAIPEGDRAHGWQIHHVNFGLALEKRLGELGVECHVQHPGRKTEHGSAAAFLAAKLRA